MLQRANANSPIALKPLPDSGLKFLYHLLIRAIRGSGLLG